jgi:5-methylthioribose kinase
MATTRGNFHLQIDAETEVAAYLIRRQWIEPDERVTGVTRAGEGNMNCTLRVETDRRSFILKQSRPWVEKYPSIPAPEDRLLVEAAFYETVADLPAIADRMPTLLNLDATNRLAQFEDLGEAADFTFLYNDDETTLDELSILCRWLIALHNASFSDEIRAALTNRAMRVLNHEHLFDFPLVAGNQFDLDALTPGLQAEGDRLKQNPAYVAEIHTLGRLYLADGPVLLHGDFYPGSWLNCRDGIRIIDPEFGFFGPAEYDVGVFAGHLLLAGRPFSLIEALLKMYTDARPLDQTLTLQFAGMEIMRRLIGVAQLPLVAGLEGKAELLQMSEELVLADRKSGLSGPISDRRHRTPFDAT